MSKPEDILNDELDRLRVKAAEVDKLRDLLVKIEQRCDSIDADCQEADKVRCHTAYIRLEIARVYPKCERPGFIEVDTPPATCDLPECWHHAKEIDNKWNCSSDVKGWTGQPGCVGYKERKVGTA